MTTATASSSSSSRTWLVIGGVLALVLICIVGLIFVVNQYRDAMTAYAWVQAATDSNGDLDDLICEDAAQAERFNTVFRNRYAGQDISINLEDFEQNDNEVLFEGEILFTNDKDDFAMRFIIGEGGNNGFLGLFGCIEYIEQLEPENIPQPFWGG